VVEDVQPLLALHYEELTLNKERVKLDPMWERYAQLEASHRDALQIFTARDDGALVGYAAFFVQPHLHYRALFPAINDVIFVHPQRRNSTGLAPDPLLRARAEAVRAEDRQFHVKPATPMAALLPKLGYGVNGEPEELIFGKFL
jgi:hypothetical protein